MENDSRLVFKSKSRGENMCKSDERKIMIISSDLAMDFPLIFEHHNDD